MPDQTIQVQISPLGGGGGGGGNADSISAEDYLTYDSGNLVVGVEDGSSVDDVAIWNGSQWVITRMDAPGVLYPDDANLDHVQEAIRQALFQDAVFNYVRLEGNNPHVLELGDEINTAIQLSWDISKAQSELDSLGASSTDIDGNFSVIDKNSTSPVGISLNTAVTATTIGDDEAQMTLQETLPDGTTRNASVTAVVAHSAKVFWGAAALDTPTESMVEGLADNELRQDIKTGLFQIDCSINATDNYVYFAWPKSMGDVTRFLVSGIESTFKRFTVSITNSFGVTLDYYVYRSLNQTFDSSVSVEVV